MIPVFKNLGFGSIRFPLSPLLFLCNQKGRACCICTYMEEKKGSKIIKTENSKRKEGRGNRVASQRPIHKHLLFSLSCTNTHKLP